MGNSAPTRLAGGAAGFTLGIRDGDSLDVAMAPALASLRAIALANRGRAPTLTIPGGNYAMSATSATITLEPWMRIKFDGNSRVVATGHTVPVFWLRNDVAPLFAQGADSENNNGYVLDGTNGVLVIEGNNSAGGAGVRLGNGDGTWGTNFTTDTSHITMLSRISGVNIYAMDHGLQFTNNNCFCLRFDNVRMTGGNKGIVTSTGTATNADEIHAFTDCFINNMTTTNVEMNSNQQLGFSGCSITYSGGKNIAINANQARLHFQNGRIENGDTVSASSGSYPLSIVQLSNMTIVPTKLSAGLLTHLRPIFTGVHAVQMSNVVFDMTSATPQNATYSAPANQYLTDGSATVQWHNNKALYNSSSEVKRQPVPTRQSMVPNGGMVGNITGWTSLGSGTIAYSIAQANSGAGSMLCSITAGQLRAASGSFPVQPGRTIYADLAYRMSSTPAPTATFYGNLRFNFYALDNTTVVSSSAYVATNNLSLTTDAWLLVAAGTGAVEVPAGAAYARVEFATNSGMTGDFYIDDVMAVEL